MDNVNSIIQLVTSGLIVWSIKLHFQLWMKVTALEERVKSLENK